MNSRYSAIARFVESQKSARVALALALLAAPLAGCVTESATDVGTGSPPESEPRASGPPASGAPPSEPPAAANPPAAIAKARFVASEYAFDGPAELAAGVTEVTLANEGSEPHHVTILRLADGKTFQDYVEASRNPGPPPEWATAVGGVAGVGPHGEATVTMDFEPGAHVLLCLVPDREGTPHVAHGMARPLTVTETESAASAPVADATLTLGDFNFTWGGAEDGTVIRVVNGGEQAHEAQLVQLAEGASLEELLASFGPNATGPPPGRFLGGAAGLSPGEAMWLSGDLSPGTYALLCFIPDGRSGKAHHELGMVAEFNVD